MITVDTATILFISSYLIFFSSSSFGWVLRQPFHHLVYWSSSTSSSTNIRTPTRESNLSGLDRHSRHIGSCVMYLPLFPRVPFVVVHWTHFCQQKAQNGGGQVHCALFLCARRCCCRRCRFYDNDGNREVYIKNFFPFVSCNLLSPISTIKPYWELSCQFTQPMDIKFQWGEPGRIFPFWLCLMLPPTSFFLSCAHFGGFYWC